MFPSLTVGFGADWRATNDGGRLVVYLVRVGCCFLDSVEFDNFLAPSAIGFLGFVSDTPFNWAQFDTEIFVAEEFGMDNLSFAIASVPAPTTIWLLGIGLAGLSFARLRNRGRLTRNTVLACCTTPAQG